MGSQARQGVLEFALAGTVVEGWPPGFKRTRKSGTKGQSNLERMAGQSEEGGQGLELRREFLP